MSTIDEPQIAEVLTMAEIEARYPNEWILIDDPVTDEYLRVKSGRVVLHDSDKEAFDERARSIKIRRSAFIYTGKAPDDMVYAL